MVKITKDNTLYYNLYNQYNVLSSVIFTLLKFEEVNGNKKQNKKTYIYLRIIKITALLTRAMFNLVEPILI
jgi:hypothetical protein